MGCGSKKSALKKASNNNNNTQVFNNVFIDACTQDLIDNNEKAIQLYKKCVDLNDQVPAVYFGLSKCYLKEKNSNLALENAMKAYQLDKNNVYYALHYAQLLQKNQNNKLAIEILEQLLIKNPKDKEIVEKLDQLYVNQGNLDALIQLHQNYIKNAGYQLSNALRLIDLYKFKKDYAAVHQTYDLIKKASPLKYQYYLEDAKVYKEQNDETNAILNIEKANEINPNNFLSNFELYQYYQNKDQVKAQKYLYQAIEDPKTNAQEKLKYLNPLVQQHLKDSSQKTKVYQLIQKLEITYPNDDLIYFTNAQYFAHYKDFNQSFERYKNAFTINPNLFEAWLQSLEVLLQTKDYQQIIKVAEQAIEIYPNTALFYLRKAHAQNQIKYNKEALETLLIGSKVSFLDEATKNLFEYEKAYAYFKLSQLNNAKTSLQTILTLQPNHPQANELMGDVFFKEGNQQEALNFWRKAVQKEIKNITLDKKINNQNYEE